MRRYAVSLLIYASVLGIFVALSPWLDLALARLFYDDGRFLGDALFGDLHHHGLFLVRIAFWIAAAALLITIAVPKWRQWAPASLLVVCTYVVTGEAVELLKPFWNRPRPSTLREFGHVADFFPVYRRNHHPAKRHRSFPSRHCARGMLFFTIYLIGRRYRRKRLRRFGITLTVAIGILFAVTSIAHGRHFLSDVVASVLLVMAVAILLERAIFFAEAGGFFCGNRSHSRI